MKIVIYDWANIPKEITLPDKEIKEIFVSVLSGDETGSVEFVDGTEIHFDASDSRHMNFNDGYYSVEGEDIKKWLEFKPSNIKWSTASCERRDLFREEDDD